MVPHKKYSSASRKEGRLPSARWVAGVVLIFLFVVVIIWIAASRPQMLGIRPAPTSDFGGKFGEFVGTTLGMPYIGDMRNQRYYPNTPEKRKEIPEDEQVFFKTREAAEKRGFRPGY